MPILDAVERLLNTDSQHVPDPVYNIAAQRTVVYQANGALQTVNPVRETIRIPMTQFHANHEIRTAIVACILERAQHVMQGLCPAVYLSRDPMELQAHADRVLTQEGFHLSSVLLNPAHLDFVNDGGFNCYVHADAPIGALIFLPEPEELGQLVRNVDNHLIAGIAIFGWSITVLTEPGDPAFLPDQESRLGSWIETLEQKPPPEPEPERKDIWERLGEEDDLL